MYVNFWKSLSADEKHALASKAKTTTSYLRHVMYGRKKAGFKLAQVLHDATEGEVSMHVLRPDIYPLESAA